MRLTRPTQLLTDRSSHRPLAAWGQRGGWLEAPGRGLDCFSSTLDLALCSSLAQVGRAQISPPPTAPQLLALWVSPTPEQRPASLVLTHPWKNRAEGCSVTLCGVESRSHGASEETCSEGQALGPGHVALGSRAVTGPQAFRHLDTAVSILPCLFLTHNTGTENTVGHQLSPHFGPLNLAALTATAGLCHSTPTDY